MYYAIITNKFIHLLSLAICAHIFLNTALTRPTIGLLCKPPLRSNLDTICVCGLGYEAGLLTPHASQFLVENYANIFNNMRKKKLI